MDSLKESLFAYWNILDHSSVTSKRREQCSRDLHFLLLMFGLEMS